jgi:predicted amidohydrolase
VAVLAAIAVVGRAPAAAEPPGKPKSAAGPVLRVAAVQMRASSDLRANVAKITSHLADCAARQVQIVAFPECAVSSYGRDAILALTAADLKSAEREITAACRTHAIAAIVGTPDRRDGKVFNSALIISARGDVVARYDKIHLAGQDVAWQCVAGSAPPPVFTVGATRASVMICHDSRFPEVCRGPVLAGARVVFYISHEAALVKESKMGPYRAQVQARAVENNVFVVHANAPADDIRTGSHGQSRIVAPDGNVLQEASQLQEETLIADLDLSQATAKWALDSLEGPMAEWWRAAMKQVRVIH